MWTRAELKEKSKVILKQNYWKCVIVGLILGVVMNAGSYSAGRGAKQKIEDAGGPAAILDPAVLGIMMGAITIIILISVIINLVLTILVWNPIEVGCERFFIKSQEQDNPQIDEVGFSFRNGYAHIGGIMFMQTLFTVLWSLLFIIPGIVKGYEYMMIPYLLAENPDMNREEAFAKSKAMMDGNKWNAFVLDLSFLGWMILGSITYNVLNVFYVYPYMYLTKAELYRTLRDAQ